MSNSATADASGIHAALRAFSERRAADLGLAFVEAARANAPQGETGRLADSIAVIDVLDNGNGWTVLVVCGAPYAGYVERGTGEYVGEGRITPTTARALAFVWNGAEWVLASVAGQPGQHFWQRTIEQWPSIVRGA